MFVCVHRFKKRVLIEQLENFLEEIHLRANSMNHLDGFWALHLPYLKYSHTDLHYLCNVTWDLCVSSFYQYWSWFYWWGLEGLSLNLRTGGIWECFCQMVINALLLFFFLDIISYLIVPKRTGWMASDSASSHLLFCFLLPVPCDIFDTWHRSPMCFQI